MAAGIILREDVKKRKNHKPPGGFSGAGERPTEKREKEAIPVNNTLPKGVFCSPRAFNHIIEF
jgi:hypothetical protein